MWVSREGDTDDWVLYVRRKDFPLAAGFLPSNVPG